MRVTGFPMSIVTPHGRKPLSADARFHRVRSGFADLPAPRGAGVDISLPDTLMSAFAMCSRKASSLLACEKERAEGHLHTIYGRQRVPCDPYRRERLEPLSPQWLRPVFKRVFRHRQRGKALAAMGCLDGHYL